MIFLRQIGAAFLLITLTLWLQCGGIAKLITWTRSAGAGDIHRLRPFRSSALVVRLTTALIAVHGLQVLARIGGPGESTSDPECSSERKLKPTKPRVSS